MDFEYVSRSVRGRGCGDEWEEILDGCDCDGPCSADSQCSCLLGAEDNYKENRLLEKATGSPVLECHSYCSCRPNICNNRVLQQGITVTKLGTKGFGLISKENISMGSFVCEYAGEVIGKEEAARRYLSNKEHNYVLTVRETCSGRTTVTYVDPREKGNLARFINHSCSPNLRLMTVRIGSPVPRIGLFALRDISAGEELCYSYGKSQASGTKRCFCEASGCLGYLPADITADEL